MLKIYPLAIVAVAEFATRLEIQSASVGVILAALGGGLTQMRRSDDTSKRLTVGQTVAEIGLSAVAGFLTFAALHENVDDSFLLWSSCVASGLVGSAGLDYLIKKVNPSDNDIDKTK